MKDYEHRQLKENLLERGVLDEPKIIKFIEEGNDDFVALACYEKDNYFIVGSDHLLEDDQYLPLARSIGYSRITKVPLTDSVLVKCKATNQPDRYTSTMGNFISTIVYHLSE